MQEQSVKPVQVLPKFELDSSGIPGEEAVRAYERDGVVCLGGAFDAEWIDRGRRAVAAARRAKSGSEVEEPLRKSGEPGEFFYDWFLWKRLPSFRQFTFGSPASELARRIMRSQALWLYFDMAIVKEPGTSTRTPWHYDEAYWPVSGTQVCNLWLALDEVPPETALRFVVGSHRFESDYRAIHFFNTQPVKGQTRPDPPRWDMVEGDHQIACAPLSPGDCVILNFRTHHSAPGNLHRRLRRRALCTHWFGDDARFNDKPYECSPNVRGEGLVHGESLECETFPRVI